MKTDHRTNPTTEAPNEAQAQSHPASRDAEAAKNRNAYWAAYRRALSGSPLLIYPNRADALLKGYAEGLAERRARWALAKAEAEAEALEEAVTLAGV